MTVMKWKPGKLRARQTNYHISATRFTYKRLWHMPFVLWHGIQLRKSWGEIPGSVGLISGASLLKKTTYTLSVWESEAALKNWLVSPYHAQLMREYRHRLKGVLAKDWSATGLSIRSEWAKAMELLRD